jgi:hypothetical protein
MSEYRVAVNVGTKLLEIDKVKAPMAYAEAAKLP